MFTGSMKVGETVTILCSVEHTCPTMPPTFHLNMAVESEHVTHSFKADGTTETTLTATLIIKNDHQIVQCTAQHQGGFKAMAYKQMNADCKYQACKLMVSAYAALVTVTILVLGVFKPIMIKSPGEFNEGQPTKVTCSASYTCAKHTPSITWNPDSGQVSTDVLNDGKTLTYVSTLTFTAAAKDSGRSLTCIAQFSNGQRQEKSITLWVRSKYNCFFFISQM